MSGYINISLATLVAQDPALAADDPRKVDATATPGNVVVPAGTRAIKVRFAVGTSSLTITHPEITTSSQVIATSEGDSVASPPPVRRTSCRAQAGSILVSQSGGAVATDGAMTVIVEAL